MSAVPARAVIVLDRRLRAQCESVLVATGRAGTVEDFARCVLQEYVEKAIRVIDDEVLGAPLGVGGAGFPHHVQVNSGVESQIETNSGRGHG